MDEIVTNDLRTIRRIRCDLESAVFADLHRRRRRRWTLITATVAVGAAIVTGMAAAGHWFALQAAPRSVKHAFDQTRPLPVRPHPSTPAATPADDQVPVGQAVQVAQFGRYTLYLLHKPQWDCFIPVNADEPAQHPESCAPPLAASANDVTFVGSEWGANPRGKTDPSFRETFGSGYFAGYVGAASATTVEIDVPGVPEPLRGEVDPRTHYFVLGMSEAVWRTLAPWDAWPGAGPGPGVVQLTTVARDASGAEVARGTSTWRT